MVQSDSERGPVEPRRSSFVSRAEEVLAALPETIVQVDELRRVVHVNRPESTVFRRAAAAGDIIDEIVDLEASEVIVGLIENARVTGGAIAEYQADSDLYRVTAKPLITAPVTLLVFRNITGLRRAGQAIVDLVRDRSTFLTAVSHELRNPLSAVVGYANLLSEPDSDLDGETRSGMVRDMTDQAWDLAGIVEDLLTVASVELGELHMAKVGVSLTANTAQVLESMGDKAQSIEVEGSPEVIGIGDPARFRQVIRNLLSNAVKHGAEPITVTVTAGSDTAVLSVTDRGPGLPDALVEEFFQPHLGGGDPGGPGRVGLGLWICKELTNLMGGSLDYARTANHTTFTASLPRI